MNIICTILCTRRYRDNRESYSMIVDAEKPLLYIAPITEVITTVCSIHQIVYILITVAYAQSLRILSTNF